MSRISKLHNWLNSEINKDNKDLDENKKKLIREIKNFKKSDFFEKPKVIKLTFWQKLKKILFP